MKENFYSLFSSSLKCSKCKCAIRIKVHLFIFRLAVITVPLPNKFALESTVRVPEEIHTLATNEFRVIIMATGATNAHDHNDHSYEHRSHEHENSHIPHMSGVILEYVLK